MSSYYYTVLWVPLYCLFLFFNVYSKFHFKFVCQKHFLFVKGTVNVISSDPPWKDDNPRFTTVPLKPLSDQE